jgi:hypothetical protein
VKRRGISLYRNKQAYRGHTPHYRKPLIEFAMSGAMATMKTGNAGSSMGKYYTSKIGELREVCCVIYVDETTRAKESRE